MSPDVLVAGHVQTHGRIIAEIAAKRRKRQRQLQRRGATFAALYYASAAALVALYTYGIAAAIYLQ